MSYGFCPICGAQGKLRERRINGDDTCVNGHKYPSAKSLNSRPEAPALMQTVSDIFKALAGPTDIASGPTTLAQALSTPTEPMKGPLAIAVASQTEADALRELLGISKGPNDQGFVVLPFGGSILSFAPSSTLLLRGLVVIPPHGGPISRQAFDGWVASAINPYLAPQAPRLIL